jgi:hypothetical protein
MATFAELKNEETNLGKIYGIIDSAVALDTGLIGDSYQDPISLSVSQVGAIRDHLLTEVRDGMVADGGSFQTVADVRSGFVKRFAKSIGDAFFNPQTGIGTALDPGTYDSAYSPMSISPNDATAYYSSGGLSRVIVDKKVKGLFANGYTFEGPGWEPEDIDRIKEHADSRNFDKALADAYRDGLVYGGSLLVPAFKFDNAITYQANLSDLIRSGSIEKDSLAYFWSADRWNCVLVPDYNISARDYLHPKKMFVPITGLSVNTSRAALIKPKTLPYWGTIRQIGWGQSDYEGYIKALLAYEVAISGIPVMAQQMSLMYRHIPLDGLIAQNGPQYAEQWASDMAKTLSNWSNVTPRTFNSIGEIKVIERNFTGFTDLIKLLQEKIAADSELSMDDLFGLQSKGMASDGDKAAQKSSGMVSRSAQDLIPQLQPIVKCLVYSTFGPDSIQALKADTLRISFDAPDVLTAEQKFAAGNAFFDMLQKGTASGLQIGDAVQLAEQFVDVDITEEMRERMTAIEDVEMPEDPNAIGGFGQTREGSDGGPGIGDPEATEKGINTGIPDKDKTVDKGVE